MSMFMVEKLCVFKVRHVYLFTSSSLSSMLCSTLIQYSTQQHSAQLEMKENKVED